MSDTTTNIRYTLTAMKSNGLRGLAAQNTGRYNYKTKEEADQHLRDVLFTNDIETINFCMGTTLEVRPVICYSSGDAMSVWFD